MGQVTDTRTMANECNKVCVGVGVVVGVGVYVGVCVRGLLEKYPTVFFYANT